MPPDCAPWLYWTICTCRWPAIQPNDKGLTQFIYGHMKDYLRRVYGRVLIGRAFRKGKPTPNYFVLARPEV